VGGTSFAATANSSLDCPQGQKSSSSPSSVICDDGTTMTCYECLPFVTPTPAPTETPTPTPTPTLNCDCQSNIPVLWQGQIFVDSGSSCPQGSSKGSREFPVDKPGCPPLNCVNCYPDD
jgi:hypothetical protein